MSDQKDTLLHMRKELLARIVQSEDQGEYSKNNIHPTNSGVMTKSKDEGRIGNLFEAKGIAYRYEKAYGMNFYHT